MRKKRILAAAVLAVCVLAAVICCGIALAVFDEEDTTHVSGEEIENSTLIIGTHLIHISALSDALYEIAKASESLSGQYEMYYKSELADGKWFEISDASGIADIMEEGKAVDVSVINSVNVRYHTKSDGITYDLMTGEAVCIFDIINSYSIDELNELDAIELQKEALSGKENKTDTDERNLKLIEAAISKDTEAEKSCEDIDKKLDALQRYYEEAAEKKSGNKDTALALMEELDSLRRLEVYNRLYDDTLPALLNAVQNNTDDTDGFYVDYDLVSAISSAIEEVEEKLIKCEAQAAKEGDTAVSKVKYSLMEEAVSLIEEGAAADSDDIDRLMENIEDITNIESGITKNPSREAEVIRDMLIPRALDSLSEAAEDENTSGVSGYIWETEYLAKTAIAGMSSTKGSEFIEELLDKIADMEKGGAGENGERLKEAAEELKETLISIKNNLSKEVSDLAALISEKEELKVKRQACLDVNKLDEAEEIKAEIEAIDERIDEEEKRLTEIINSDVADDTAKAQARAALSAGGVTDEILNTKESILQAIEAKQYEDGMTGLEAMEEFININSVFALNCMSEIYDNTLTEMYLKDNSDIGLKEIKEMLENIISENSETIESGLSEKTALSILESHVGAEYKECSGKQRLCMAVALYTYGKETGSSDIQTMAHGLVTGLYSEGNPFIYIKIKNEVRQFIPLKTFSDCTDYRYVFLGSSKSVTLAKGTEYYTYTVYKNQVVVNEGTEEMDTYARYQGDIYLTAEYMEEKFKVSCVYIDGTDYGVLIMEDIEENIVEMVEVLYNEG